MSELLPCPFCGGEAYLRDDNAIIEPSFWCDCGSCDCGTPSFDKPEYAIKAWNTRQSSEWVRIYYGRELGNLPTHDQEVLFKCGDSCHAGIFINDYDGFSDTGDFGFFDNRDNFYEADSVSCWMPLPQPPITESDDD